MRRYTREFTIEKQPPLQECHYWLKIRIPIMIGLQHLIQKSGYILFVTKKREIRKHFAILDIIKRQLLIFYEIISLAGIFFTLKLYKRENEGVSEGGVGRGARNFIPSPFVP